MGGKRSLEMGGDAAGEEPVLVLQPVVETAAASCRKSKRSKYVPEVPEGINPLNNQPFGKRYYELLEVRSKLPAYDARRQFLRAVRKNQCTVVVGETGSGKTTQCTQFLIEAGFHRGKCIACTQPRRVAAMSVARRVAEEMDVELGKEVGYRIRFEDCTEPGTTILKYCTDGSLLREAQGDPQLTNYSCIVLDEAHERTLDTDILFGLLKEIMKTRTDIKIVVMSATLDAEKFQKYFNAPVVHISGRVHPVEILYTTAPEPSYFDAALRTVLNIHETQPPGDILVFLTGEEEIDEMKKSLDRESGRLRFSHGELCSISLYSSLPPAQQQRIFEPAPKSTRPGQPDGRKCIIATNIAETSITVDGIVYVVDPGLSKQKTYNPRTRIESLLVSPISKASAKQRAGRAGRTRPGKCYRLYTEEGYNTELTDQTFPEILRSNLGSVILTLMKLGITNLIKFEFMEPPAVETMMRALEELHFLGAINDDGKLTPKGEMMSEFPLDPQLACMLVESSKHQCVPEMLILCAMLSVPTPYVRPRDCIREANAAHAQFADDVSDHFTLIRIFEDFARSGVDEQNWCYQNYLNHRSLSSARRIRQQLEGLFTKLNLPVTFETKSELRRRTAVRKAVLAGFHLQLAANSSGKMVYNILPDNILVAVHPSSNVTHQVEWLVYHELVMTTKNYIRTITQIEPDWLKEIASVPFLEHLAQKTPSGEPKRKLMSLLKELEQNRSGSH